MLKMGNKVDSLELVKRSSLYICENEGIKDTIFCKTGIYMKQQKRHILLSKWLHRPRLTKRLRRAYKINSMILTRTDDFAHLIHD